jgi:hypothetical protein
MDMIDGIIVGAAAAAIGSIIAYQYINRSPQGGAQPNQPNVAANPNAGRPTPLYVVDLEPTPSNAAPVAQVNPVTEAAYNQQPVVFEAAFGPGVNQPAEEAVLPQ